MRAKGRIRITEDLLKGVLGIPKNVSLDKIYVEEGRGVINIVVSTDAPAYMSIGGEITPITFDVVEGQEIPSAYFDHHTIQKARGLRK